MITRFLALQATYDFIEVALYQNQNECGFVQIDKNQSNALLVNTIGSLLNKNNLLLNQLSFIAVSQGPAPFTSLRIALATVNGIAFSSQIPIVGIDGLRTFAHENKANKFPAAYLLNAFSNDVYYALQIPGSKLEIGCISIEKVLELIKEKNISEWRFFGNAALLFQDKIKLCMGTQAIIENAPTFCSLNGIALAALEAWKENESILHQALPLYLKETTYKKSH